MSRYLLDTHWVVETATDKRKPSTQAWNGYPQAVLSIITYGELYEGAGFAHDPQPAPSGLRSFLEGKAILSLTQPIMDRFAQILGSLPRQIRQQIAIWRF